MLGEEEKLASLEYDSLRRDLAADATPPADAPTDGEGTTGDAIDRQEADGDDDAPS